MKCINLYIQDYCRIKSGTIYKNSELLYKDINSPFDVFIKAVYKKFSKPYPKFYKMDSLSKLSYITAEILLEDKQLIDNTALIFSNKSSSLETDKLHQEAIDNRDNYYPSPAVFVYTLPNICMGEICIRHKLHTENSFFIFEAFNAEHLYNYSKALIQFNNIEKALCAWIEKDENGYDAFMYLIGKKGQLIHSPDELNRLYRLHD